MTSLDTTNKSFLFHLRRQQEDDEREESPRPTKRRYSGPTTTMELTPRRNPLPPSLPSVLKPKKTTTTNDMMPIMSIPRPRGRLLPKTPLAPLPRKSQPMPFLMALPDPSDDSSRAPGIFLPTEDAFDTPAPSVVDVAPTALPLPLMATAGRLKPRPRLAPKPQVIPEMMPQIQEAESTAATSLTAPAAGQEGASSSNKTKNVKKIIRRRATMSMLSELGSTTTSTSTSSTTNKKMKRRASLSLLEISRQVKSMERTTAVPAPPRRRCLKHSRSCHALCA